MTARSLGHRSATSRIIELLLSCKRCLRTAEPGSHLPALSLPFHCRRPALSRCARVRFRCVDLTLGEHSHFISHLDGNLGRAALRKRIRYCGGQCGRTPSGFSHFERAGASLRYRTNAPDAQKCAISQRNDEFYQIVRTVWRSGRDSNPRYGFAVYSLSRRAPSTTRPPLRIRWKRHALVDAPRARKRVGLHVGKGAGTMGA